MEKDSVIGRDTVGNALRWLWTKCRTTFPTKDVATQSANGLMSAADKKKLDALRSSIDLILPASGWANGEQTISAPGVTATNLVIVTVSRWGVQCIAQGSETLTFLASILPAVPVTAHVSVFNDL